MKELKFKAWDEKGKYFKPLDDDGDYFFREDGYGLVLWDKHGRCKNTILLQYTGLKDMNGKEIYEGDIIKHNQNTFIIQWEDNIQSDTYGLVLYNPTQPTNWRSLSWLNKTAKYVDTIGNIYENPELIQADAIKE